MKSHIHWHLMIQWHYPRWRMTPLPFCQSVVFTKSRAPFPAFHSHFCPEAATDGLTTRHYGSFLLWVLLAKGIAIDMYTLGKATYLVHPAWNPTPQVTVWVWLSSSISPPVFLPGVRQKQLSQVTLEKFSGNPVTWSSPVSGEDGRKGLSWGLPSEVRNLVFWCASNTDIWAGLTWADPLGLESCQRLVSGGHSFFCFRKQWTQGLLSNGTGDRKGCPVTFLLSLMKLLRKFHCIVFTRHPQLSASSNTMYLIKSH